MKIQHFFLTSLLSCSVLQAWAVDEPQVTTDPRFARGATMAFGRATFKSVNGNSLTERGFCWSSTTKEPTIDDSHSKQSISNNGLIFWMKDLEPSTVYYARPYAVTRNGAVGYGSTLKIITLPKGQIAWTYDDGGSSDENTRIRSAVESCVNWWNDLSSLSNLTLQVHYGAQTPTADCSYGGWMRVGPNSAYQKTGTIMHEALHAIGVGTHGRWNASNTPLRAGSGTGRWLGDRANEVLRFWDNDSTACLTGDATHMWPYGINGAHEDNGSNTLYIATSLLAQALGEDGLPPTTSAGYGVPHYAFDQEDDVKYYLKNESENHGLLTSYLVETADHKLQWKSLSAAEAVADDAAAWYVTFTPDNQYYQVRNAQTGRYITFATNGFETVSRSTPSVNENLHLMRSRIAPTASGSTVTDQRAYWLIHPAANTDSPYCLAANTSGTTTSAAFDLTNAASRQRWLILTAEQAMSMESAGLTAARSAFSNLYSQVSAWASVAHADVVEGSTDAFSQALMSLSTQADTTRNIDLLSDLTTQLEVAAKAFLKGVYVTDLEKPFDLTFLLMNPAFDGNYNGWSVSAGGTYGYHAVEFYQTIANVSQTVKSLPAGTYQLRAQAFQRPGSYTQVYNDFTSGNDNVNARLYLESASKGYIFIKNLMADRSATSLHSDDKRMADGTYVPNTMASTQAHFDAGYYENLVEYYRASDGDLKVGLIATKNDGTSFWAIFSNFRLYYLGALTREQIQEQLSSIREIHGEVTSSCYHDLSGRAVGCDYESLKPGIYLYQGKKLIKQ